MNISLQIKSYPYIRLEKHTYNDEKRPADLKNGDILTIKSDGATETSKYGTQTVFDVETPQGMRKMAFNNTSLANLIDAFGSETEDWNGKSVYANIKKQDVKGVERLVAVLTV